MNKLSLATATAVVTLTQTPQIFAENKLEETVVTSSRIEMPLRQVGTSVSVLDLEDIRGAGFNSVQDVLRTLPSVNVGTNGGPGSTASLRIRGEEAFRTRTYIDDIDISDTSAPQVGPRFEHLLTSGIERIEVLRGPQGLMYGADAGGIVNLYTHRPTQGLTGSVSAETGRYDTHQFAGNIAGGSDLGDFSVHVADYETDGFNARTIDTDLRDDDGYDNTTYHLRGGLNVNENIRIEAVYRDVDGEGEFDVCGFPAVNDCDSEYEQQAWRLAALITTGVLQHTVSYNYSDTDRQFYTLGVPSFGADGSLERFAYQGNYAVSDNLNVVVGAEYQEEELDDGTTDRDRDQDAYYAEIQASFIDSLYITAGVRHDDNEDFGTHNTYRLSSAYVFDFGASELKLKATYGTGFRAPSLYEVAYNVGEFAGPPALNFELDEETSKGFDIGIVWADNDGSYVELVYFDQEIEDEIFFDPEFFSGYLQGNGKSESSGIEFAGEAIFGAGFSLSGNYTYNDTEQNDGTQRFRRPEHLANLELKWLGLNNQLTVGLHVRGAYDALDTDGSDLDDYEVVNFNAQYQITSKLAVYGRVENLLDEDYEEVSNFNTSGSAAYAGVRYSF